MDELLKEMAIETMAGAFWTGCAMSFFLWLCVAAMTESLDFFKALLYYVFVYPFLVIYAVWELVTHPHYRADFANDWYEWRIERVRKKGEKKEKIEAGLKQQALRRKQLEQEMVEVCYKYPHEWVKKEGKK